MDLDIKTVFKDLAISRYVALASITLVFFDWLLVLDEEVKFVSTMRLSKGKVLYYFTRTATALGLLLGVSHIVDMRPRLSDNVCHIFLWISALLQIVSIFTGYWMLTLRLLALYKSRTIVVWLLYMALFATYFTSLGLLIHSVYSSRTTYVPMLNVCVPFDRPVSLQGVFEAPLVFEVLLFGLMVWRAWEDWRAQRNGPLSAKTTPLLRIMYRDGVFYFCVMVAVRAWNVYIYAVRPVEEMYIGLYIMWSLICVLSCRVYLNIVQEARRNHLPGIHAQSTSSWTPRVPTVPGTRSQTLVHSDEPNEASLTHSDSQNQWERDKPIESYPLHDRLVWAREDKVLDIC